jgi:hypothetical protein
MKPFPSLDIPIKVPFSDLEESLLFSLSLTLTKICAGQPKTRSFLKSIVSPVRYWSGARKFSLEEGHLFFRYIECCTARSQSPLGKSAYLSMALALAKIRVGIFKHALAKDRSALPFSQGCSTFEKSCFAPRVLTTYSSKRSLRTPPPLVELP